MPPSNATEFTDLPSADEAPAPPTRGKRRERFDFGWPAAMKRATAAAYLDISEPSLMREVRAGRIPKPFKLGARDHWRKEALDAALARLAGDDWVIEYRRHHEHTPTAYDLYKAEKRERSTALHPRDHAKIVRAGVR